MNPHDRAMRVSVRGMFVSFVLVVFLLAVVFGPSFWPAPAPEAGYERAVRELHAVVRELQSVRE